MREKEAVKDGPGIIQPSMDKGKNKVCLLPLDKWVGGSASGVKLVFGALSSYSE